MNYKYSLLVKTITYMYLKSSYLPGVPN